MAYRDLGAYIEALEKRKLLHRIKAEVDKNLEITEITDRVCKKGGPALYFENVRGHNYPVVTNLFGTMERIKLALEVEDLDDIGKEIISYFELASSFSGLMSKIKALPKLARVASFLPKTVKDGPCKEVIEKDPDLTKLPILKCWPEDGGPFITLPVVFTKNPSTGLQNAGMYRMQVYDKKTTGMHWHIHKDGASHYRKKQQHGERLEAAVALGGDPAVIYAATAPLPADIDEMLLAGFLRRQPVEMVPCETVDIKVPANAEFILEGYLEPGESKLEGPFGDHTGYYSLSDFYPVFHLTCITRRRNPVYPATIVGRPPMEDAFLGKVTERIFLPVIRLQLPEILDMNMPPEGVFHNCVIVSIRKTYPGQARKVMHALWGMGLMMLAKLIIVVDENVNVQDLSEVMWRVFNNIDARRDVVIVDGPLDALDHASPVPCFGSKMGIDATRKWPEEGHRRKWPNEIIMKKKIREMVDERWEEYGF